MAGLCNVAEGNFSGLQLAGILNVLGSKKGFYGQGLQVAAINVMSVQGKAVQIGVINYAKNLRGIQIGAINVNKKSSVPFLPVINARF